MVRVRSGIQLALSLKLSRGGVRLKRRASGREIPMFLTLAVILAVCWALGLFAFHAVGGLIHLLLIVAVVAVVVHFVRGNRVRA